MHSGICNNSGLVYEGLGTAVIPSIPTLCIIQAKLIAAEGRESRRSEPSNHQGRSRSIA